VGKVGDMGGVGAGEGKVKPNCLLDWARPRAEASIFSFSMLQKHTLVLNLEV
jgi:hypothetical protein